MKKEDINDWALLLLVFVISAMFIVMIHRFLMTLLLAGIFSALFYPIYSRLVVWFRGRRMPASAVTIILVISLLILPMAGLLGIIANEAMKVGEIALTWAEKPRVIPDYLSQTLQSLPFYESIAPYKNQILVKAGELLGSISGFMIERLSTVTFTTVNLIINTLIFLYCMFFFLIDGDKVLEKILYYLPLEDQDERRMLDKFTSVARATIKGTLVIGILQGGLAGLAFYVVGIGSAVFWGAIMAVLSIIPSVGSALIWAPAAIILVATGHIAKGIGLAAFCGIVVGSLDNVLRPILVGKDTQMHELMIFLGTLGGIIMFGVAGMIIGPILAALFITVWEIYGIAFKDVLPRVGRIIRGSEPEKTED